MYIRICIYIQVILSLLVDFLACTYWKYILWCFFIRMCEMTHLQEQKHTRIHACDMTTSTHSFICAT